MKKRKYNVGWKQAKILLAKTGGRCYYCGEVLPRDTDYYDDSGNVIQSCRNWDADHLIPLAKGGINKMENIVPACKKCNSVKRDKSVDEFTDTKYFQNKVGWQPYDS